MHLNLFNSRILFQQIIFIYVVSSFVYSYLLFKYYSLQFCVSLHFSNIWSTLSSSLHRGHSWHHWWNGGTHPLILKIFTLQPLYPRRNAPRYPLKRRLRKVQSWSEYFVGKKNPFPVLEMKSTAYAGKYTDCAVWARGIIWKKLVLWDRGGTVVKVLCCKSEGHWFDPSWCHWHFSMT